MKNFTRLFLVTAVVALALHATADVQAQQAAMTPGYRDEHRLAICQSRPGECQDLRQVVTLIAVEERQVAQPTAGGSRFWHGRPLRRLPGHHTFAASPWPSAYAAAQSAHPPGISIR